LARQFEGVADARLLVAEAEAVLLLAGREVGDEVEIEAVADPVAAGVESADGVGGAGAGGAGADADDVQRAGGAAEGERIERGGREADGAGGAARLALRY